MWDEGRDGAQPDSLEDWEVELWQVMENEPSIRATLRKMSQLGGVDEMDEEED